MLDKRRFVDFHFVVQF